EQEFDSACMESVKERQKLGYHPGYFLKMRAELGLREAAHLLMNSTQWPEAFSKLWEMKRLDLSIEASVHNNPKFRELFDKVTLDNAEKPLSRCRVPGRLRLGDSI